MNQFSQVLGSSGFAKRMEDKWVLKILLCRFSLRKEILSHAEIEEPVAPYLKGEASRQGGGR